VIPAGYVHVVFTLPHALNDLARRQPRIVYEALFESASATLLTFALDPRHLGAHPGITAVLHTWTQRLELHIHLHCIVTAGGLDPTRRRWVKTPRGFLFSVRALSRVFRGKYLEALRRLANASMDTALETELHRHDWVVYAKAPPAGPAALLDYLARYTHRVAIGNERILGFDGRTVTLRWRDSFHGHKKRLLTLDAVTFLSRFVQHVLPRGFKRVRHYGLLAPANKAAALAACHRYFGIVGSSRERPRPLTVQGLLNRIGWDVIRCEVCGSRHLRAEPVLAGAPPHVQRGPP
jgi:hypothetical protein